MVQLFSAIAVDVSALHQAMLSAFADYAVPMRLSQEQFALMLKQRSFDPSMSSIAASEQGVAAFWLVGRRGDLSYLISSGTCPAHRRQGLSRQLARRSFEQLQRTGVRSMTAEVLTSNKAARALYAGLGFEERRKLDCYSIPRCEQPLSSPAEFADRNWSEVRGEVTALWDHPPSWQNEVAALNALEDHGVACKTARINGTLAGYAALIRESGTLAQIAVHPTARRLGIASRLIARLGSRAPQDLRVINADAADEGLRRFILAMGGNPTVSQYEIWRPVRESDA